MLATLTPEPRRLPAALAVALLYAAFCALIVLRRQRRHRPEAGDAASALLVAHASQTGFAEELARRSAETLRAGAVAVRVAALGSLTAETLAASGRVLFVVSTTGEGDPPTAPRPSCARSWPECPTSRASASASWRWATAAMPSTAPSAAGWRPGCGNAGPGRSSTGSRWMMARKRRCGGGSSI